MQHAGIAGPPPDIDRIFHALGDPTRRSIVERLGDGPVSVSELARSYPVTLAAIMQHLRVLEQSGLVRTEKAGRVRTCRLEPTGLSLIAKWVAARRATWERRFDRLGALLVEPDE